jgi:YD repeat-containing protein
VLVGLLAVTGAALTPETSSQVDWVELPDGQLLKRIVVPPGLPPATKMATVEVPPTNKAAGVNVLEDVPAFDWAYGCAATSAAMMAGYYDNVGYPNIYTGPANGGVCPMDNSVWGYGECPLSATHQGYDGRSNRGHVDDYWVAIYSSDPDPYIVGGWPEHSPDCTGDFMKTSQSAYGLFDGGTLLYFTWDGSPYDATYPASDGGYGLEQFFESRGYVVTERFNQEIVEQGLTYGFSYAQFRQEIDAGRPVLIHLDGHTMLGYGYNTSGSIVYIHDTWDHNDHQMTWGGSYDGMAHTGVTVIHLAENNSVFSNGFESGDTSVWSSANP